MNPADRWHPGWQQFMVNQQRAQAGGNRLAQPVQQPIQNFGGPRQPIERNVQQRRNNPPAHNANRRNQQRHNNHNNNNNINNQNVVRRENRAPPREALTRDDLERIEATTRKNFQTRTALEYDKREDQCWKNIQNVIENDSRQFSLSSNSFQSHNSGDIIIPSEEDICSNLRKENQNEVIMKTRELLVNYGATEQDLTGALANLEIHLRRNSLEYNVIEDLSNDLINNAGYIAKQIDELDNIMYRLEQIRLQKN
ncbi:hypothetical protein CAEBREN_08320 [Caenorhabditis brenneri]|uniref:Uncharacterized protein n=1 Tax=Caenorhabditis brenneri TaxID=135651 RepID=G0PCA5_CAEBE|nr:hypothetical protein CAEBREN_08320 [Caenorhabditis brenneri]